jgi:two-component system response regulator BaeR
VETSKGRILLVEDEKPIADVVADYLKREGFQTHHLSSGAQVIPWLEAYSADLVLLDIMLPEIDGLEICKALRRTTDIPIIMLTARVEEIDKLIGLEIGAIGLESG